MKNYLLQFGLRDKLTRKGRLQVQVPRGTKPCRSGFTPTKTSPRSDAKREAKFKAQFAGSSPDCKKGAIRGLIDTLQSRRYAKRTLQAKKAATNYPSSIIHHPFCPAFTLIEIMVVMVIMAVVMALGVTGWLAINKTAHTNNTRMILSELSAISTDYHARVGSYVKMKDDTSGSMYNGNNQDSINSFISRVKANAPKSAELFSNLNSKFYDNSKEVVKDSWGQYIRYTTIGYPQRGLPRRISAQKGKRDDERPYFASAGPDGKWGRVTDKGKLVEGAKDNIYSFNLKSHKNEGGR